VLGQYVSARDFMCTVAEITGGQAVALSSAALLGEVIVNGSAEEICLTRLQRQVEEELRQVRHAAGITHVEISAEECCRRVCTNLQAQGITTMQMSTDGVMAHAEPEVWRSVAGGPPLRLAGVKAKLAAQHPAPPLVTGPLLPTRLGVAPFADSDRGAMPRGGRLCDDPYRESDDVTRCFTMAKECSLFDDPYRDPDNVKRCFTLAKDDPENLMHDCSFLTGGDYVGDYYRDTESPVRGCAMSNYVAGVEFGDPASVSVAMPSTPLPVQTSTHNTLSEESITLSQVSRMMRKGLRIEA